MYFNTVNSKDTWYMFICEFKKCILYGNSLILIQFQILLCYKMFTKQLKAVIMSVPQSVHVNNSALTTILYAV